MAISLADIAAKAKTYPSKASDFGRTLAKLAESIVAHVSNPGLPSYADDAAAGVGGLVSGALYVDSDDQTVKAKV